MKSRRKASQEKKINPHFWVFCEGKTEEAYIRFLRSEYRLPVEIIPKIAGSGITEKFITQYKKRKPVHEKDCDFLIYDADVGEVLEKLKLLKDTILIASNPAIELWFLLHYKNQTAALSVQDCIRELANRNRNPYKKGVMDATLKKKLSGRCAEACSRSKKLKLFENPSTNMHEFIEALEAAKGRR